MIPPAKLYAFQAVPRTVNKGGPPRVAGAEITEINQCWGLFSRPGSA